MLLRRLLLILALTSMAASAGCEVFRFSLARNREARGVAATGVALPAKHQLRHGQYVFISDFELKADQGVLRELSALRETILKELKLPAPPSSALVNVYLFEDRDRYEAYMKQRYPDLPRRRAFFVAQPRSVGSGEDLLVYTFWGDHIRQDLRHELTHATLHSILKDVPLWLDEGLAEYFELPPDARGVNRAHLMTLIHDGLKPDMVRLEQLGQVQQMTPTEYRESWAWVHFMLRGDPEARKILLAYVQQLRHTSSPGPIQPKLKAKIPDLNAGLAAHLGKL